MPKLPTKFSERMYKEQHDPRYLIIKGNRVVQDAHYTMPWKFQYRSFKAGKIVQAG